MPFLVPSQLEGSGCPLWVGKPQHVQYVQPGPSSAIRKALLVHGDVGQASGVGREHRHVLCMGPALGSKFLQCLPHASGQSLGQGLL